LLFDDLPDPIFALHSQNDPVAAVVTHVYSEKTFLQSVRLAEVEFSQSAVGLYQFGELDVPDELYLHKVPFDIMVNNSCAEVKTGFLKDCEFFTQGLGR
jgi:hypothetical protein